MIEVINCNVACLLNGVPCNLDLTKSDDIKTLVTGILTKGNKAPIANVSDTAPMPQHFVSTRKKVGKIWVKYSTEHIPVSGDNINLYTKKRVSLSKSGKSYTSFCTELARHRQQIIKYFLDNNNQKTLSKKIAMDLETADRPWDTIRCDISDCYKIGILTRNKVGGEYWLNAPFITEAE